VSAVLLILVCEATTFILKIKNEREESV